MKKVKKWWYMMMKYVKMVPAKELENMKKIKEIRFKTGLSQVKFSAALGIPRRTLQNWELGERECPQYVADLIEFRITHDDAFRKEPK